MNPTRTQTIKNFLTINTHADLASLYNHDMEVQVNVACDGGTHVESDFKGRQWRAWSDGIQTWYPFRIPKNAATDPTYEDREMTFDLNAHVEGIGLTGWDWKSRLSRWVAFDFDSLTGHSERHTKKLNDEELAQIRQAVSNIDWVTIRRSTSGTGLHLYVFLDPVSTANHTEHAALGRAILGKLSALVGVDFFAKVDTLGGNMWIWHRKMRDTNGLELLKQGSTLDIIPPNWKDHVKVISGRAKKSLPKFVSDQPKENQDIFEELTAQRIRIPLDADHRKLIEYLETNYPNAVVWDNDNHLLTTHTTLIAEAHEVLQLKGPFKTIAEGTEKGHDWNMFAYPLRKGAWALRRFTPGVAEHPYWEQDGNGYTRCFLNQEPDLPSAARMNEGVEDPKGGYCFNTAEQAQAAAIMLGADLNLPPHILNRKAKLKLHKNGKLIAEIVHEPNDHGVESWLVQKKLLTKMFDIKAASQKEPEAITFDDEVRHLITESGEDHGWVIKSEGKWHTEPYKHVTAYLASRGFNPKEVVNVIGNSIGRHWTIVNRPFQPEYLMDRQWNQGAAQLKFVPTLEKDNLKYNTWLKVLSHIGKGLDEAVKTHKWCKENGVFNGTDYLKIWVACLFQFPFEPLPYLFLYGDESTGKSILHEAIDLLMTRGVVRADTSLTSSSGFNGELENAVLCVVEETDVSKSNQAHNRIKDWVTSIQLPIHKKQRQPYTVNNTTHWIQCANSHLYCPVFSGDTRITMINVAEIEESIPKPILLEMLRKEASDFLAELLSIEIPISNDRLRIPAVTTEDKLAAGKANQTLLQMFVEEHCHYVEGKMIKFSDFYERFKAYIDPNFIHQWSTVKVGREIPLKYPKGRLPGNGQTWIGNMAWESSEPDGTIVFLDNGFLHTRKVST